MVVKSSEFPQRRSPRLLVAVGALASMAILPACNPGGKVTCDPNRLKPTVVQAGDSYWSFAQELDPDNKLMDNGAVVSELLKINGTGTSELQMGQTIKLPEPGSCRD